MADIAQKSARQKSAEADVASFEEDLGPFVVAAETTRMAMVFADAKRPGKPIIFANDAFIALTGYSRSEVLGQDFDFLMANGADSKVRAQISDEFKEDSRGGLEVRYRRKDGSEFWVGLFTNPVRDRDGSVVQYFASFVDLTKHIDGEAQARMLINEMSHRVKNTLATVQSIVWQALQTASTPEAIRDAIEPRLFALSRSHDLLTRENWESADLRDILNEALAPFVVEGSAERIVLSGDYIRFLPKSALALSIAFNELATNAVKYGALSNEAGSIRIEWKSRATPRGDETVLCWREQGGPGVVQPLRKGFGSQVIERGLAHELKATVQLDYRPDGLVCTMRIPASRGDDDA